MKAKKILAVILSIVMVIGIVAAFTSCNKTPAEEESTVEAGSEAVSETAEIKTAQAGKLIMATNATFPPYESIDGNGTVIGIDAEVAQLIANKLGLDLVIENVEFDSIIAGVTTGKFDMGMAGMTVTEERLQSVDFSTSYAKGIQSIIVPEGSDIKTVDDLKGDGSMKIGTQMGTTGYLYCSDDYGEANVVGYKSGPDAVEALKSGKVQAVVIDNEPAKAYVAANAGLTILDTAYADEDYAICMKKGNTGLNTAIDNAVKELIADGSIQKIVDKYIVK